MQLTLFDIDQLEPFKYVIVGIYCKEFYLFNTLIDNIFIARGVKDNNIILVEKYKDFFDFLPIWEYKRIYSLKSVR